MSFESWRNLITMEVSNPKSIFSYLPTIYLKSSVLLTQCWEKTRVDIRQKSSEERGMNSDCCCGLWQLEPSVLPVFVSDFSPSSAVGPHPSLLTVIWFLPRTFRVYLGSHQLFVWVCVFDSVSHCINHHRPVFRRIRPEYKAASSWIKIRVHTYSGRTFQKSTKATE